MLPARDTNEFGIAATGSDLTGAYQLTKEVSQIFSGAANTGVKLSDAGNQLGGQTHVVINASGSDKKVYPATTGQQINGISVGNPITLSNNEMAILKGDGSGAWFGLKGTMPTS